MQSVTTLPDRNPDKVRITCPLFASLHGYSVGDVADTSRQYMRPQCRDVNGFEIWVHSIRFNRSVWLSSAEYSLLQNHPK